MHKMLLQNQEEVIKWMLAGRANLNKCPAISVFQDAVEEIDPETFTSSSKSPASLS